MRDLNQRILALRENYFASVEERQRCLAEAWGCVCDPETGIAVVSINGPTFASYWGPGTYSNLRATVEGLLDRDDVRCIVLEINSPGGDVNGLFECCEYISKANETKPITAHVTGMCCSAAYAIAASCDKVIATQTSEIGSVGVYAQAYDDQDLPLTQRRAQEREPVLRGRGGRDTVQDRLLRGLLLHRPVGRTRYGA